MPGIIKQHSICNKGQTIRKAGVTIRTDPKRHPPVRLPLGSNSVVGIKANHVTGAAILAEWRATSVSTDF